MGTRTKRLLGFLLLLFTSALPLAAQRNSAFMKDFRFAMSKKDKQLEDKHMDKHQDQAVLAIVETCQAIGKQSSANLEAEMRELGASWRRVHKTDFADKEYRYFSRMKPMIRESRRKLILSYGKLYAQYDKAIKEKKKNFVAIGSNFQSMTENFVKFGDLYMAAVCAEAYASCFDEGLNGDKADLRRACEGYGKVVEYRGKLGLKGRTFTRAKSAFDELEYQGYGSADKGPEARKRKKAEADPSYRASPLEMHFEVAPDFSKLQRPNYSADSVYQAWFSVALKAVGSTGKINSLGELSPNLLREAATRVAVDADGDGKGDAPVAVNGNLNVVEFSVGSGDAKRPWAMRAITGSNRDTVQGINPFNLASDESNMTIYVAPAASMVGMIGETRIQIFDDNMDGRYGSGFLGWAFLGLRKGDLQIEMDSMLIGTGKRAQPWSEVAKVGDDWYGFYPNESGNGISYNKVDLETGTLKLDLKGLKAESMVVQGTGKYQGRYFDLAGAKKGVEVPVGSYAFLAGVVSKGKRSQKLKAQVLASPDMPLFRVEKGGTTTLALGSPFRFDFEFSQDAKMIKVPGSEIVVMGRGKETYQRLWNCRPQPSISMRKAGKKKGTKGVKMRLATDQNELIVAGYGVLWAPYDQELAKASDGKMEVQLVEKKNKLFGKVTSDWKKE